jgi:hypothetical protein
MNETVTTLSRARDSRAAGEDLGRKIRLAFNGGNADAVIVFASAQHDYVPLLESIATGAGTDVIVGSSSAGEFSHSERGEGYVSALAIRSDEMRFTVGLGTGVSVDPLGAARRVASGFAGIEEASLPYRSALVMTDALAGHADAVVEELTVATRGNYRFFGGGAGDDGLFKKTHVFAGTRAVTDAIVALEILSARPIGVGVAHGWVPAGPPLRVTEASGSRIASFNGAPAIDAIEDFARQTGQSLDRANPLPFFLHNILGIRSENEYRLRVPLAVQEDGSVVCAADVPQGSVVHVMRTSQESAVRAAEQATRSALEALGGLRPGAALVFDCVATRLRLGAGFSNELQACAELLRPAGFVGCNTYGQIARAEGQFGGFHNCTAVVCVLPA